MARTAMNVRLQRKQRRQSITILHEGDYPINSNVDIVKVQRPGVGGEVIEMVHITISIPKMFNRPDR